MTRNLIAAGLALLVALGIWAYLATHERVTETVFTGFRGEARVNDFKAAEMLLAAIETAVRVFIAGGEPTDDLTMLAVKRSQLKTAG